MQPKPILLTGAHRSGTTWLGQMLALTSELRYVEEPFNFSINLGAPPLNLKHWFHYIPLDTENYAPEDFEKALGIKINYHDLWQAQSVRQFYWESKRYAKLWLNYQLGMRPIIKDPLAFFSAPWLHKQYDAQVLVLFRHPAAYLSSIIKMNWWHDYTHFSAQKELLNDYLSPFEEQIHFLANNPHSHSENALWIWNMVAHTASIFKEKYPNWIFLKYEDLAQNPLQGIQALYQRLGLNYTELVEKGITASTSPNNLVYKPNAEQHLLLRNSQALANAWRKELSTELIDETYRLTLPYSQVFYNEADWAW